MDAEKKNNRSLNCANKYNRTQTHTHAHSHTHTNIHTDTNTGRMSERLSPGYIISSSDVTADDSEVPGNQSELAVQVRLPFIIPPH